MHFASDFHSFGAGKDREILACASGCYPETTTAAAFDRLEFGSQLRKYSFTCRMKQFSQISWDCTKRLTEELHMFSVKHTFGLAREMIVSASLDIRHHFEGCDRG